MKTQLKAKAAFLKNISKFDVVKNTTLGLSCIWKKNLVV